MEDVLIIGGGVAGLSAAINVRARGKRALVVSNPAEENPLWRAQRVENYPGLPGVSGAELLQLLRRHAEESGAEFLEGRVLSAMPFGMGWLVSIGSEVREAGALILASGAVRSRPIPGEERLLGRGVSYCATCDGMLYREKNTVVLGWTESAEREAEFLRSIGCKVRCLFRPADCEILGETEVTGLRCGTEIIPADAVFVLRPAMAPDTLLPGLAMKDGWVVTDRSMATNLPGVFSAGDCTGAPLQAAKATGEGLIAGQSAAKWINERKG